MMLHANGHIGGQLSLMRLTDRVTWLFMQRHAPGGLVEVIYMARVFIVPFYNHQQQPSSDGILYL